MTKKVFLLLALCPVVLLSCNKSKDAVAAEEEDQAAKKELQGVWMNDETEDVAFRLKGDSVYFPDSTIAAQRFLVVGDTFVMDGANRTKYAIVKRTAHLFQFVNAAGEVVKLVKTPDKSFDKLFENQAQPVSVNQGRLIKTDTVVFYNDEKYHCYVQVNPTSYKVLRPSYNDDGMEVDNAYYDNIVHLAIYHGSQKLISRDFKKEDFKSLVPENVLRQSVFSDIVFNSMAADGIHYFAVLAIPGTSTSFMVELIVSYEGRLSKRIREGMTVN